MSNHNKPSSDDEMITILLLSVILIIVFCVGVSYFKEEINNMYAKFKVIESYPYMLWNDGWKYFASDIMHNKRNLAEVSFSTLANYFNKYASIAWLPIYTFFIIKTYKTHTIQQLKKPHTPESLLKATSQIISNVIPWVGRNITQKSYNIGAWRLMESPLFFVVKHKCIYDPNGNPFQLNQVYNNCGDTQALYNQGTRTTAESNTVDMYESSFVSFTEPTKKIIEDNNFILPSRVTGSESEEIKKFEDSSLVPFVNSVYLNKKNRTVLNTLDERKLRNALLPQLGVRIHEDPFCHLAKTPWKYGLAMALYLHGLSDKTKKEAFKIFDIMNFACSGNEELNPQKVNTAIASHINETSQKKHKLFHFHVKEPVINPHTAMKVNWQSDQSFVDGVQKHFTFEYVFFMALLKYARQRGVVSISNFGWVKYFDRTLWYALSQVGRIVCSVEAAGAWSHYHAEESLKQSLSDPYLDIAIEGIKTELCNEGWLNKEAELQKKLAKDKQQNNDSFLNDEANANGIFKNIKSVK